VNARIKSLKNGLFIIAIVLVLFFMTETLFAAESLTVGVAANFMLPFRELAVIFESRTAKRVEATYTSTGNLYGQIKNGAPYDLFLSADQARPQLLLKAGLTDRVFVYARGEVVLWSAGKGFCESENWEKAITLPRVRRVAIANPETAPYGEAAKAALQRAGLWREVEAKLVFAQTVAQVFQYAHTEAVDAGFCARASVYTAQGKRGCYFSVEQAPPVIQAACVLGRTVKRAEADAFAAFLMTPEAVAVKRKYGYE
jgi:molybdate transport system substrate-binding protein